MPRTYSIDFTENILPPPLPPINVSFSSSILYYILYTNKINVIIIINRTISLLRITINSL